MRIPHHSRQEFWREKHSPFPPVPRHMGVLVAHQEQQMMLQEDVMVGSEQERLLLLTSMLGVAEHDLVSMQDRLNAMHQLQLEKDQELMKKERQMGSLHDENARFHTQLMEISKVVSDYASKRTLAPSAGGDAAKADLKALKEAHQKRLLRTFNSHSLERQYVSLSAEAEQTATEELMRPGELAAAEQPRIANEVR